MQVLTKLVCPMSSKDSEGLLYIGRKAISLGKELCHAVTRMIQDSFHSPCGVVKIELYDSMSIKVLLKAFSSSTFTAPRKGPAVVGGIRIITSGNSTW